MDRLAEVGVDMDDVGRTLEDQGVAGFHQSFAHVLQRESKARQLAPADMDWAGWALFGLVATAALTAVMIMAQLAGLTRLDLPLLLGTIVTEDPDRARVAGFFLHLVIGQGFALGYAACFSLLGRATWWLGGLLGLLHVAVSLTVFVPSLRACTRAWRRIGPVDPRPRCWSRPGCSWPQLRRPDPLVTIAAHLTYGVALGVLLGALTRHAPHSRLRAAGQPHRGLRPAG